MLYIQGDKGGNMHTYSI